MSHNAHDSSHGSVKSYIVGFILSIVLTIIPYWLVANHVMAGDSLIFTIVLFAIAQLLVQLIFFLHLGTAPEQRNNTLSFIFTLIVVILIAGGSLWVMWNLNYNMMDH